jgi:hypothetical protein
MRKRERIAAAGLIWGVIVMALALALFVFGGRLVPVPVGEITQPAWFFIVLSALIAGTGGWFILRAVSGRDDCLIFAACLCRAAGRSPHMKHATHWRFRRGDRHSVLRADRVRVYARRPPQTQGP